MLPKHLSRRKRVALFQKVIKLRKQGCSYSEITKQTNLSKSTIHDWLAYSGLTLSKEHFEIQAKKRIENYTIGTKASAIYRKARKENEIYSFINSMKKYLKDPKFVAAIMLYQAEGSKGVSNGFSNSDFRLIKIYINFLEKYLNIGMDCLSLRLYIHESRKNDLKRIRSFWAKKIDISSNNIHISWKHNIASKKRINTNYVGQFEVSVCKQKYFTGKILAISDIILKNYIFS